MSVRPCPSAFHVAAGGVLEFRGYHPSAGGGKVVWCEIALAETCRRVVNVLNGWISRPGSGWPGSVGPEFQFRCDMEVRPGVTLGKITDDKATR